jgi:hypothetical protein
MIEKMISRVTKTSGVTTCDSESLRPSVVEPLHVGTMEIFCHTLSHRHTAQFHQSTGRPGRARSVGIARGSAQNRPQIHCRRPEICAR